MKITSMNYNSSLTDDKFHTPQLCNIILFETLSEPILYREFNTCELPKNCTTGKILTHIDNVWIYNHKVGDTVHFEYLLKSKFFEIKNR